MIATFYFRCANRALLPRRTAPDDHQIVFVSLHSRTRLSKKLPLFQFHSKSTFASNSNLKVL